MSRVRGRASFLFLWGLAACAVEGEDVGGPEVLPDPVVMDPAQLDEYANLAPVTEALELSDEQLAHVLELRRHYGLSTDPVRVRALHDHPADFTVVRSRTMLFGGLLLDESELPTALERAEVEYRAPDADIWAQSELGPRYGGSFLEGTEVILQCAGCDPGDVARAFAARRDVPEVLRGRVEIRVVEHSFAALQAMEARLAAYLDEHDLGSNGTTVDIIENAIDLYAGPSTVAVLERELATLEAVAGGPVELVVSDIDPEDHLYKSEALPYALAEAGQFIFNGSGTCTSGFAVQGYYGPFILTAGHCAAMNQTWYQGGLPLGRVAAIEVGPRMDAALISTWGTRNNWGRVHVDYYNDRAPVTFAVTTHYLVGQTVCNTGYGSTCLDGLCGGSSRCGVVTSQTFRSPASGEPVWGLATYRSVGGDSGAGVIWPTGYGYGAAGIVRGMVASSAGSGSLFSRMPVILSAWGLSLSPY